ncbi:MAG: zf-HC2 domain-containing protein [Chloroflexi bacterium]|nr:zf-HC2 domain-containing protein [Chloroflexota bacterium]MBU1750753.1 zf-HC2 domain-containing protein [Chloroflexota bacterium]MBU1877423.1 zf-HC2 domain-containing protein [Chloroflexota bacterium]
MSELNRPCGLDKRWLNYYLDGDLAAAEKRVIEQHTERCAYCRRELGWLQATEAALTTAEPPAPSADFTARLLARAAAEGTMAAQPAEKHSLLDRTGQRARQATIGFRYARRVVPDVSVPESWSEQAGDALKQGTSTVGRGTWRVSRRVSRWLLRRRQSAPVEEKPRRRWLSLPRLSRQPSR